MPPQHISQEQSSLPNMLINIYTANHGKLHGIEDYLVFINKTFKTRGHDVKVSDKLDPSAINVIIDEFTNQIRNREISDFRKSHPNTKILLLLTEFIESRLLLKSINFFGGLVDASVIAALDVYARLIRKDFKQPTIKHWIISFAYAPILLLYALLYRIRHPKDHGMKHFLSQKIHPCGYLHLRYLGLEKMIGIANGIILAHDQIAAGVAQMAPNIPILGTIYPELDDTKIKNSIFSRKKLFIEITGSITPYRKRFIDRVNSRIILLGIHNIFGICTAIPFSSNPENGAPRGAYALHPPQSRRWKYCSPTRIYRSLQVDNCIPVITRHFCQHPIEDLCLVFRNIEDSLDLMYRYYRLPTLLLNELEPKLNRYMHISRKNNDALVNAILGIAK